MSESSVLKRHGGRPAAGTDPDKRLQILEGAGRVFSSLGFDAASMSDIARAAGVSKATLYVYFPNKEELFAAICGERRDRNIAGLLAILDPARPPRDVLNEFGHQALERIMQPTVLAANRIVVGVAERMPELGRHFFDAGPRRLADGLAQYIEDQVARGTLHTDEPFLAAAQFLELVQVTMFRPGLFCAIALPPPGDDMAKVVASAVRVFMAAYGGNA